MRRIELDLGDAVLEDSRERLEKRIGSNAWLRGAARFDHNLRLSAVIRAIAATLFNKLLKNRRISKLAQRKQDFEVLCANLLLRKHRPISVPLNRKNWVASRYRRASYFVLEALRMLLKSKYIEMRKGYGHENPRKARRTKIWATSKFRKAFESARPEDCIVEPVELIRLHDDSGKDLAYRDTKGTLRVRKILQAANLVTDQARVEYINPVSGSATKLGTRLSCVYNTDFDYGGRFYTADRDGYQGYSEEDRKHIYIDGEPTVELDFSGMFPHLLYATEGIQYDDDPYMIGFGRSLRPVMKMLLIIALNSEDKIEAVNAGNKFLCKNPRYYQQLQKRGLSIKKDLFPALCSAHKPIAKHFFSGKEKGLKIMNLESKITLTIIKHFSSAGIPILAIHDSFIVQAKHKERLAKVMQSAYYARTNGFMCPIK